MLIILYAKKLTALIRINNAKYASVLDLNNKNNNKKWKKNKKKKPRLGSVNNTVSGSLAPGTSDEAVLSSLPSDQFQGYRPPPLQVLVPLSFVSLLLALCNAGK